MENRKNLEHRNKNRIRSFSEISHGTSHRHLTIIIKSQNLFDTIAIPGYNFC